MITNFNYPRTFENAHLSRIELSEDILEKINYWIKNPRFFLILLANPGVGKTYICHAICRYLQENKKYFRLLNERDFFSTLRNVIKQDWDYNWEINRLCETEFFLLDDICSGRPEDLTEWQKECLFNFIDCRYQTGLPTVITSNHFIPSLAKIFPERIASRLKDSRNVLIEFRGNDKRIDTQFNKD